MRTNQSAEPETDYAHDCTNPQNMGILCKNHWRMRAILTLGGFGWPYQKNALQPWSRKHHWPRVAAQQNSETGDSPWRLDNLFSFTQATAANCNYFQFIDLHCSLPNSNHLRLYLRLCLRLAPKIASLCSSWGPSILLKQMWAAQPPVCRCSKTYFRLTNLFFWILSIRLGIMESADSSRFHR